MFIRYFLLYYENNYSIVYVFPLQLFNLKLCDIIMRVLTSSIPAGIYMFKVSLCLGNHIKLFTSGFSPWFLKNENIGRSSKETDNYLLVKTPNNVRLSCCTVFTVDFEQVWRLLIKGLSRNFVYNIKQI